MSIVTIPRDVTSHEVAEALRDGLGPSYEVLPGTRMPRSPLFGKPQSAQPELIMVAASPMARAQVTIIPRAGRTDLRITPAGLAGDLLMNILGVARAVRQTLLDAPGLGASGPAR